ncbi:hypothetical protein ACFPRL_33555 [Pseudoclavibacter helvolus]
MSRCRIWTSRARPPVGCLGSRASTGSPLRLAISSPSTGTPRLTSRSTTRRRETRKTSSWWGRGPTSW